MKRKRLLILPILCLFLVGCSNSSNGQKMKESSKAETGFVAPTIGSYDSADTAIVVKKDVGENTITLQNLETGKQYTLHFDGATNINDKYGEVMSMAQIEAGDMVDLTFLKSKKKIASIALSNKSWTYTDVSKFELGENAKSLIIVDDRYQMSNDIIIVSDGKLVDVCDLNSRDTLKVIGIDHVIYSIVVEKGHGYLRLKNAEYFIGGWIEVGSIIVPVTEDMLLIVPEGSYQVLITHSGSGGTKEINIVRNEETELDVGDLKGEEIKEGSVIFTVNPSSATIYIDGDKADISDKIILEYGIHQMIVKAEGYDTITQYVKVGKELASIDIEMEKTANIEETTVSGNTTDATTTTTSENIVSPATSSSYSVYVDSPEGAEVYVDGTYIGIVPINFKKVKGNYVVTLRKTGFQTRSYTVIVDDEEKDISYSFSELLGINN